jgi:ADP-ribose pyrophosphatase YjhB (NUDIX family)
MLYRRKAYGIIKSADRVLIFREQKDDGEDVAQFPGGTIEDGESIEEGLLREVFEESGLSNLRIVRQLGCDVQQANPQLLAMRHFYLLECHEPMQETWLHYEMHSSEHDFPLPYLYTWITIKEAAATLGGGLDRFVKVI